MLDLWGQMWTLIMKQQHWVITQSDGWQHVVLSSPVRACRLWRSTRCLCCYSRNCCESCGEGGQVSPVRPGRSPRDEHTPVGESLCTPWARSIQRDEAARTVCVLLAFITSASPPSPSGSHASSYRWVISTLQPNVEGGMSPETDDLSAVRSIGSWPRSECVGSSWAFVRKVQFRHFKRSF